VPLAEGYPYLEAEVRYACREYAATVEDVLSRRTRLAFLNSAAALECVDRVGEIMAEELGWSAAELETQKAHARDYLASYGGPSADKSRSSLREATASDLRDIFERIDVDGSGFISAKEASEASELLGFPTDGSSLDEFRRMDADDSGGISFDEFVVWWNSERADHARRRLARHFKLNPTGKERTSKNLSGTFLG